MTPQNVFEDGALTPAFSYRSRVSPNTATTEDMLRQNYLNHNRSGSGGSDKQISEISDFMVDKRPESTTTTSSLDDADRHHHHRRSMSPFSAIQESRASAAIRMSKAAELMRRATDIRKAAASLAAATAHFDRTSLGSVDRRLKIPGAERFPSVEVSSTSSLSNNGMAGSGYTASSSLRRVRRNLVEESNRILSVGGVRSVSIREARLSLNVCSISIRSVSLSRENHNHILLK